jgi:hypothetical protein
MINSNKEINESLNMLIEQSNQTQINQEIVKKLEKTYRYNKVK